MQQIINHIENIRSNIEKGCGALQIIELKLRLLAEDNELYRKELYGLISKKKTRNEYWNCDIAPLVQAIESAFGNRLTLDEKNAIKKFNKVRNKMLHGDLVDFFDVLGVSRGGQYMIGSSERNQLSWG